MMEVTTTAAALSSYGLYTIVSILLIVVFYLYREQNRLEEEMRQTLAQDGKDTAKLLAEATIAIQQSTKALEQISGTVDQMKVIIDHYKQVNLIHDARSSGVYNAAKKI